MIVISSFCCRQSTCRNQEFFLQYEKTDNDSIGNNKKPWQLLAAQCYVCTNVFIHRCREIAKKCSISGATIKRKIHNQNKKQGKKQQHYAQEKYNAKWILKY